MNIQNDSTPSHEQEDMIDSQEFNVVFGSDEIKRYRHKECWEKFERLTEFEKGLNRVSQNALFERALQGRAALLIDNDSNEVIGYQSRPKLYYEEFVDDLYPIFFPEATKPRENFPSIDVDIWSGAMIDYYHRGKGGNIFIKKELDARLAEAREKSGETNPVLKIGEARDIRSIALHVSKLDMNLVDAKKFPYLKVLAEYAPFPPGQGDRSRIGFFPLDWATDEQIGKIRDILVSGKRVERNQFSTPSVLLVSDIELAEAFEESIDALMKQVDLKEKMGLRTTHLGTTFSISTIQKQFPWVDEPVNLFTFAAGLAKLSKQYRRGR